MTVNLPPAPQFGAPVDLKPAPEVLRFLAVRRSHSAVNLIAPGPGPEDLDALLRLAARVPDHGKLTPWRFVVLEGADKAAFADRLDALAAGRGDKKAQNKLAKLKVPPTAVVVVSTAREDEIPLWEQELSAGAVCTTLLYAALAMGYGANWITDWYSFDPEATAILGLDPDERVAGFILLGAFGEPPLERERPDPAALVSHWTG